MLKNVKNAFLINNKNIHIVLVLLYEALNIFLVCVELSVNILKFFSLGPLIFLDT